MPRPHPSHRPAASTARPSAHPLLAALALVLPALQAAAAESVVRFAPLPLENERVIHEQFRGLVDYLEETAGVTIRWRPLEDYGEIIARFRAGELDLAYLGPLPYVVLAREHPEAEPLGCFRDARGRARYTCSLVAWGERALAPGDVTGMRIGLTQPYSTCGYLAVSAMLGEAGRRLDGDGNRFEYAGSHSRAALGVVRGEYDVAGVKTAIAGRYRHLNLRVIATSDPYPGFTLVANGATLDPPVRRALGEALLALDPEGDPADRARVQSWGAAIRRGAVAPGECDYSGVAAALDALPWPLPGSEP